MRVITVIGNRPQFVKAGVLSRLFLENFREVQEIIVHTGQHYDANMSDVFFDDLAIPVPRYNLNVNSVGSGVMIGEMVSALTPVLNAERPDGVIVYGDTNSTLAGALAAFHLNIPVIHVEAGLRSGVLSMPEEKNRIIVDSISSLNLCVTEAAAARLRNTREIPGSDWCVGDIMYDSMLWAHQKNSSIDYSLEFENFPERFAISTIHRSSVVTSQQNIARALDVIQSICTVLPVVFLTHPAFEAARLKYDIPYPTKNFHKLPPISYLKMQYLLSKATAVVTDSGGLQKEAYWHQKPCITLREETEWTETIEIGANTLTGMDVGRIRTALRELDMPRDWSTLVYGNGKSGNQIANHICNFLEEIR